MSSISDINHYQHDITGKFNGISSTLQRLGKEALNCDENEETFHAIHEVLVKMVHTSRMTLLDHFTHGMTLTIHDQDQTPGPLWDVGGVKVYCHYGSQGAECFYSTALNTRPLLLDLGSLLAFLPIKRVAFHSSQREEEWQQIKNLPALASMFS